MERTQDTTSIDLKSLFETSKLFNSTYELSFISQHILRTVMGKFLITKGFLFLLQNEQLKLSVKRGSFAEDLDSITEYEQLNEFAAKQGFFLYPLTSNNNIIGFLGLGKPLNREKLTDAEINFLTSLLEFTSGAIENSIRLSELKESNNDLAKKVQEMRTLYEISNELNGLTDKAKVYNLYSLTVLGQAFYSGVTIYQQVDEKQFEVQFQKGISNVRKMISLPDLNDLESFEITADHELYHYIFEKAGKEKLLVIPIKSNLKGIVLLKQSPLVATSINQNRDFYLSLTHMLDISLSTISYFEEALLKQQLENDIKVASEIQMALLPSKFPKFGELDCFGANIPSKTVGGDYFDISKIDNNRLLIAIADVTGKGIPASLLMANLQSMIKVLIPLNLTLSEMTSKINQVIYENTAPDKFITFFWGIIDISKKQISFVNAGHNPPYIIRNGELIELNDGGVILGVMPSIMPYETGTVTFEKGDKLFVYTDGVTEAMNEDHEEYGDETLKNLLLDWTDQNSENWSNHVLKMLKNYTGNAPQSDDITLISIRW